LYELKRSWAAADGFVHVNQFIDADALQLSFAPSLNIATFKEELKVLKYQQLKELTDELKGIGAHNMNTGQQSGLMGREKLRRFKQAYEAQRLEGGALPATYQVFTVVLEKSLEN
jgi:malonyl-CoA O-methyltransferase